MSEVRPTLTVENVVASTGLDRELDLPSLSADLPRTEYDPDSFPGLVHRIESPATTLLLFRSGRIACTGADGTAAAEAGVERAIDELRDLGIPVAEDLDLRVENLVASGDLDRRLNLNAIAVGLGLEHVEYEPEQFPGLFYRDDDSSLVVLLFANGKVVVTGATSLPAAEAVLEGVIRELGELGLLEAE